MAPMVKRFTGLLNRPKSISLRNNSNDPSPSNESTDSPDANGPRAIRLFCESGSNSNGGEEVLHLPVIVEAAESSPTAAANAAQQIRKFLGKEFAAKPHVQYNAIMLIRILSDNPGATFTRNFDSKFVSAVKELLRNGREPNTQQILRETLDSLEVDKSHDEGLKDLLQMWRKEKGRGASFPPRSTMQQPPVMGSAHGPRGGRAQLPSPAELASRVEEAKNTAKILLQLVQSTPTGDVLNNELLKEFSDRCASASRSMQTYINCDNPPPDHDTMQTLIETNEQLSLSMSRHQRAVLAARRALGANTNLNPQPAPTADSNGYSAFAPPSQPPQQQRQQQGAPQLPPVGTTNGFGQEQVYSNTSYQVPQRSSLESYQPPPGPPTTRTTAFQQPNSGLDQQQPENPFADPPANPESTHYGAFAQPQTRPKPSQTFKIEPEPAFTVHRQNTSDWENAYSDSDGRPSPILSRASVADDTATRGDSIVTPSTPTYQAYRPRPSYEEGLTSQAAPAGPISSRPGPGPWHTSDISPSFVGRQTNAANGVTMHGAQADVNAPPPGIPEIDGYSQVGRRDRDR